MAYTTTFVNRDGSTSNAYNIDFSVGAGVRGNLPEDIMLIQALFKIIHFQVQDKNVLTPPAGATDIEVDGKLGPQTLRFMLNLQQRAKKGSIPVRIDGIFDPFRRQGQLSTLAKVQYAMEILNHTAFFVCRQEGLKLYDELASRPDIPRPLAAQLGGPRRRDALKYMKEIPVD